MDKQSAVNPGKGVKVSALKISGFQVEIEKPKQDTSEVDEWVAQVIRKTETGDKTKNQGGKPTKVKSKAVTYPQINIVTVSPRNPELPNPVDTYISTAQWMPKEEIQKYYHLHPDVYDQDSVQTAIGRRFPDGLSVQDLCPIPSDDPERVKEPRELRNMPQNRKDYLQENIKQSHAEIVVEASPDGQTDKISGSAYNRTLTHGNERYENLMLTDHGETYTSHGDSDTTVQKDVEWILSKTPLSTIGKLSQVALAYKWSGHGTSMVDLKARTDTPRSTPCSVSLSDQLCDCPANAAYDIGRGRGNPRKICLGHNCWGITLNVPLQEIDRGEIRIWIDKYGCSLANNCPKGFCVHIRGVANLDKENFLKLLDRVNDRNREKEVFLEDIQNLRPPAYMNQTATLQTFRCTDDRTFSTPIDPDRHHQAIYKLWNLVKGNGQTPKMGTTALAQIPAATETHPLPHSGTPDRPSPPPRNLIKKVTQEVSRVTRHTNPGVTRSPYTTKISKDHPHQSVKNQPPTKMQCTDTPNRKRVLLAAGISLLLLITAGAATFGTITSHMRPVMDNETFTQVSGHKIQRRDTNITASDDPSDVNTIVALAKERAVTREEAQKKLNNGQIPIQTWVHDVTSVSFFTNLGGLEEDFNEAMELLDTAFFSMDQCLRTFRNASHLDTTKDLCERTIAGIHSHIRSAMNPIEEAFWTLNSACATEVKHKDFLIKELEHIKQRLETEPTGSRTSWYKNSGHNSAGPLRRKRAIGLITIAIIGAVGLLSAIPIALAVEDRAQQVQIDSLHNTMNLHHDEIKFIRDAVEPIEYITAASTSANHRISNGVLLVEGVINRLGSFINRQDGKFITTEKNTARAIATANSYYHSNHSTPISDDPDKEYAIQRQSCAVVTKAESSRTDKNARSTCPQITIVETVVCAMPHPGSDIIPHPHITGAYIDTKGDGFTMHGWVIYSNPHHSFKTTSQAPMDGYKIQNMGRKIFTRSGVSVSFLPARQVLADRIVIHTTGEFDLLYVRVTCHHGEETETGYITMFHNEDFTLGYNCALDHKLIRIQQAAIGVSVSYEDETAVERTKRHTNRFSILARNNNGENILGFLNDRIRNHHDLLRKDWLPATGIPGVFRPQIGTAHWPTILSVCMAAFATLIIAVILIRSRMLGKIWICCPGPHTCSNDSISSRATNQTSIA